MFSVLGYSIRGDSSTSIKYQGIKFIRDNQGIWSARVNDKLVYVLNNPKNLENISNIGIDILEFNSYKKIYLSTDPSEQINNLLGGFTTNILPLITTTIRPACFIDLESCKTLPLKDCNDSDSDTGIIVIKKSNINKIEYSNNCLIIQGDSEELQKMIDKWVLELALNG